jgi:hypothetical protein
LFSEDAFWFIDGLLWSNEALASFEHYFWLFLLFLFDLDLLLLKDVLSLVLGKQWLGGNFYLGRGHLSS